MAELFGKYYINAETTTNEFVLAGSKIRFDLANRAVRYTRTTAGSISAQATIIASRGDTAIGVYPVPPIFTPRPVAKNVYVKFKSPVIVDQRSEVAVYAAIPIDIGVYRQSEDEELLLDSFSSGTQRYALYGSPETGVVCRYVESDITSEKGELVTQKYQEAQVSIRIRNDIDNVVRVSKVIIPIEGVILDHAHDDAWLPGRVDMVLDSAFGKDVVNVHLAGTKVKRPDKTSLAKREESRSFLMDAGY